MVITIIDGKVTGGEGVEELLALMSAVENKTAPSIGHVDPDTGDRVTGKDLDKLPKFLLHPFDLACASLASRVHARAPIAFP